MWEPSNLRRIAKGALIAIIALTGLNIFLASRLGFDYNFENFFPQDDPDTDFFREYRSYFESDNDFIVVGLKNEEGVFQPDFLQRVDSLADVLQGIRHVDTVITPTQLTVAIRDPLLGTTFQKPLLRTDSRTALQKDSAAIWKEGTMLGTLFSEDGKSIGFQIKHTNYLSKQACDTLALNMTDAVLNAGFDEAHVVGRALGQTYYVDVMQRELIVFVSLGIILITLFLWVSFRSLWGIWVPITVVLLSVVWILGFMKITGKEIDLMLIVLPTIIFVVGMSDVVHVLTKYYDELRTGKSKYDAIKVSFKEIGLATLLTSVTTAIGFLTLLTSSIMPISEFGVYTAAGVFIAFILAYSLLPAVLILSKAPDVGTKRAHKIFWTNQLHRALRFTIRNRKGILAFSVVLIAVSIWGMSRIEVNNFILEDLRDQDPLKQEFVYFEENFSGARPFEMAILLNDGASIYDRDVLVDIARIDSFLINQYGVGSLFSPARLVKLGYRQMKGGGIQFDRIPEDQETIDRMVKMAERFDRDSLLSLYINEEAQMARISGKVGDYGAQHFFARNDELRTFIDSELADRNFDVRITGTANLIDLNNKTLAVDMTAGLLIAFLVVAIIVGIMFKRMKMVIICLIPNFLPLLMIAGIMGFSGIDLKVSTSIIFTIAFGIAVDDTIHFMTKLRLELAKGRSMLYALKRTYITTGKAIIVTSIILCGGFMTLILSNFLGTFYIGLLISMTLLFAVLADLFVLPVLIMLFYRNSPLQVESDEKPVELSSASGHGDPVPSSTH
jgi:hypothetical protein